MLIQNNIFEVRSVKTPVLWSSQRPFRKETTLTRLHAEERDLL